MTDTNSEIVVIFEANEEIEVGVEVEQQPPIVVEFSEVGLTGPKGDKGDKGDAGAPGSAGQFYHHVQNELSADWLIVHNLGYKPALAACEDDANTKFRPGIEHLDDNSLIAHFIGPMRGTIDFA